MAGSITLSKTDHVVVGDNITVNGAGWDDAIPVKVGLTSKNPLQTLTPVSGVFASEPITMDKVGVYTFGASVANYRVAATLQVYAS